MITRAVIVAFALALASSANAVTVTFKQYKEPKDDAERQLNSIYLSGVSDGLLSENAVLQSEGRLRVFCPPPTLAFTGSQADDILKRAAQEVPKSDQLPIAVLLVAGLKQAFPCGK